MRQRSYKRLGSVAHNFAAHTLSGLCTAFDGVQHGCWVAGVNCITLDLHSDLPNPPSRLAHAIPMQSIGALHERFLRILCAEGFSEEDLMNATVSFYFSPPRGEGEVYANVKLQAVTGTVGEEWLGLGNERVFLKPGISKFRRVFDLSQSGLNPHPPIIYSKPFYRSYKQHEKVSQFFGACCCGGFFLLGSGIILWYGLSRLMVFIKSLF